ncbi:MAG: NAD(P)/FAD-dependent oxidoreductase [Candidatus Tectomicrobia bacterium]|nr:NAD(P)/FAD-dependent oxidoreductase [Candidatus Tectomicrobia bacterium]
MSQSQQNVSAADAEPVKPYDAIIIGAGIAGMYQLYRLRELGLSVRVFESGAGVGGTWYWNRYPGARFDSESYSYGYSFSEELLQEWDWSEHFSAQPETLRYLNVVADKFDLRKDIEFNCRVTSASYDESENCWEIELENGSRSRAQFLITAIGILSAPQMPNIEGIDSFQGDSFHTSRWPHEPVDFTGKRVAVIGTGATGVQVIQEVAKTAGQLTVFQRTPNYCAPLQNGPIDDDTQRQIKASYPEIFDKCRESHGGFLHNADPRYALEVSPEEREAFYEKLYGEPGFGIWMGNFRDIFVDPEANETISEFIRNKIRERVKNPEVAEKLVPTDHGFGTRRVPLETHYYEVYNQDNVQLVDVRETPIERITPSGIRTSDAEYAFDLIIYATGFDAVTGAFDRIDIRGVGGQTLKEKWADGPRTYLGLQIAGFPNLLTLVGPHNAATFCNIPRCIEQNVEWVTELIRHMRDHAYKRVVPTLEAEDAWTEHVYEIATRMLFHNVDSWFMGVNTNVPGKQKRTFVLYSGGAPAYREKCDEVAANGYEGFVLQ